MELGMLTTTEAGRIAGVPGDVVRKWVRAGKLTAVRCGGMWLIDPTHLDAYLAEVPPERRQPRSAQPGWAVGPHLVASALVALDGVPATADELAVLVGRHPGNVRKFLLLLAALGHAERREQAWALTAAGETAYRAEVAA